MRSGKLLSALLVAGAALSTAPVLSGCGGGVGYTVEVSSSPPPPRYERAVYRRGYVWIDGYWTRSGGHWLWRPGHYERSRPGYVYQRGRWERRGSSYIWIEGRWRPQARVRIEGRS